jgi:Uma2 family endonuclease
MSATEQPVVTYQQDESLPDAPPYERVERLTLTEWIARYSAIPFEYIHQEIRPLMPHVMLHQFITRVVFRLLDRFCIEHQLGEVFFEVAFVEMYGSEWVKGSLTPDILFFRADKWAAYTQSTEEWQKKPSLLIPDLAVEIVSPNDRYTEIEDKVDEYLAKGVGAVWIIDPQHKRVRVYAGDRETRLRLNDTLMGGEVLPGFSVPLTTIFS